MTLGLLLQCRKITAVAQIVNFLGSPFAEAFQKSPPQLLQLVPLKGQEALCDVKLPVATHSMPAATVVRILAESFLKARLSGSFGSTLWWVYGIITKGRGPCSPALEDI